MAAKLTVTVYREEEGEGSTCWQGQGTEQGLKCNRGYTLFFLFKRYPLLIINKYKYMSWSRVTENTENDGNSYSKTSSRIFKVELHFFLRNLLLISQILI